MNSMRSIISISVGLACLAFASGCAVPVDDLETDEVDLGQAEQAWWESPYQDCRNTQNLYMAAYLGIRRERCFPVPDHSCFIRVEDKWVNNPLMRTRPALAWDGGFWVVECDQYGDPDPDDPPFGPSPNPGPN